MAVHGSWGLVRVAVICCLEASVAEVSMRCAEVRNLDDSNPIATSRRDGGERLKREWREWFFTEP
jgi:hypothetical protein